MRFRVRVAEGCPLPGHVKKAVRCGSCPLPVDERAQKCKWYRNYRKSFTASP